MLINWTYPGMKTILSLFFKDVLKGILKDKRLTTMEKRDGR